MSSRVDARRLWTSLPPGIASSIEPPAIDCRAIRIAGAGDAARDDRDAVDDSPSFQMLIYLHVVGMRGMG